MTEPFYHRTWFWAIVGTATAKFSSHGDYEEVREALHRSKYVRLHGTVIQVESIRVSN